MKKPTLLILSTVMYLAALGGIQVPVKATPTCDEDTTASGCIMAPSGGKATFNLTANFDLETITASGHLTYRDETGNVEVITNELLDYGTVGGTVRAFQFRVAGEDYDEARVVVTDNGDSANDIFEIQLLENGNILYQASGTLTSDCPGGIVIVPHCENEVPCLIELTVQCAVNPPNPPPAMNDCEGKVRRMVMRYTREDCSKMTHNQASGKAGCTGTTGQLPDSVYIRVTDSAKATTDPKARTYFKGTVQGGQNYTIDAGVAGSLKANTYIYIYDAEGGMLLQTVQVHTSCSQPLAVGNQFGANVLVSLTTTGGGTDSGPNADPMPGDSCSIVGTSAEVDFFYTIRNAGTEPLPKSSLVLIDSFGPVELAELGTGTLAPGEELVVMVTEQVTGPFPFTNQVSVAGGQGNALCNDQATIVIRQKDQSPEPEPEPEQCDDFVTGGGWIVGTPSGERANFGVHGGIRKGKFWGGLNYIDHSTGMHVKSTGVTGYTHLSDVGRQINFNVKIDGQSGTAIVKVYDNGEPGRNDVFSIQLSNGYMASGDLAGPRPGGGNLQLHKSKCKTPKDEKPTPGKPKEEKPDKDKFKCDHKPQCKSTFACVKKNSKRK